MKAFIVALACTTFACGVRPTMPASPQLKSEVTQRYLAGATTAEVATSLSLAPDAARELLRLALRDLNRAYYERR